MRNTRFGLPVFLALLAMLGLTLLTAYAAGSDTAWTTDTLDDFAQGTMAGVDVWSEPGAAQLDHLWWPNARVNDDEAESQVNPQSTFVLSPTDGMTETLFLPLVVRNSGSGSGIDVTQLVETDDDILGISDLVPGPYADAMAAGARVVNLEPMNTFFVLWTPEGYEEMATRRVMVIAHGNTGDAYREMGLELDFPGEPDYAIVTVQWWSGQGEQMYSAQQFYAFMDVALRYMAYKYHAQLDKCALRGWSLGSEISFEVTYLDRINDTNYLKLTISHDGGMMPDPDNMSVGKEFTRNLYDGLYGDDAFEGRHFYLYAGTVGQVGYMRNTEETLTNFGGVVERLVEDADAGHDGFYRHTQYHEEALQIFFQMTP